MFKKMLVRAVWSEMRLTSVVHHGGMNQQELNYLIPFNFILLTRVGRNETNEDE
jgi:hypothetical protein